MIIKIIYISLILPPLLANNQNCKVAEYMHQTYLGYNIEEYFRLIENHNYRKKTPQALKSCTTICNNVNLYSVYESMLAKEIMLDRWFSNKVSAIYKKAISGMMNYDGSLKAWMEDKDYTHVLPVAQKYNYPDLKRALEEGNNPALQLDFLLYNAKKLDGIGLGNDKKSQRDKFYHGILIPLRGTRTDITSSVLRNDYGIARFDVPQLFAHKLSPWKHWGRDICKIDPQSSAYNKNATALDIPLLCGLSGTNVIALFSFLISKNAISVTEAQLLILSIWSILCSDGGHSLNEVLGSTKIFIDHLISEIKINKKLKNIISLPTLRSLKEASEEIDPIGNRPNKKFGAYWDVFFRKIKDKDFELIRKTVHYKFQAYFAANCRKNLK